MADGLVLRHVQAVGGVGELRRPEAGQDGHRRWGASATVSVRRLHLQQVLLAGGQRFPRGPDLAGAPVHLEALLPTWRVREEPVSFWRLEKFISPFHQFHSTVALKGKTKYMKAATQIILSLV